uniref:Uncharacterized protein n=1 Tax=Romanomermis culicivorax TaxID=13658 RepID=A0A915KDQ0_ROMCU
MQDELTSYMVNRDLTYCVVKIKKTDYTSTTFQDRKTTYCIKCGYQNCKKYSTRELFAGVLHSRTLCGSINRTKPQCGGGLPPTKFFSGYG